MRLHYVKRRSSLPHRPFFSTCTTLLLVLAALNELVVAALFASCFFSQGPYGQALKGPRVTVDFGDRALLWLATSTHSLNAWAALTTLAIALLASSRSGDYASGYSLTSFLALALSLPIGTMVGLAVAVTFNRVFVAPGDSGRPTADLLTDGGNAVLALTLTLGFGVCGWWLLRANPGDADVPARPSEESKSMGLTPSTTEYRRPDQQSRR